MKFEYKDVGLATVNRVFNEMRNIHVRVGVVGAGASEHTADGRLTLAEAMLINEYGTDDGHVPARKPIRSTLTRDEVAKTTRPIVRSLTTTNVPAELMPRIESVMERIGEQLAEKIRNRIFSQTADAESGGFERNAEDTIRRKGFDYPLVERGELARAITYKLLRMPEGGNGAFDVLEPGSAVGNYEGFEISGDGE